MKFNLLHIILGLLIIIVSNVYSQDKQGEVKPNGYNYFYYPDGKLASEGGMINGKPEGYWITYYENGKVKAEGNRKNHTLDGMWMFYDADGDTIKKISYKYDKKNGYAFSYTYELNNDSVKTGGLVSKELMVNDLKQGKSYYYYPEGMAQFAIEFLDNKRHGNAREYDKDSVVITLLRYNNDIRIERITINRHDKQGLKQGVWKDFYPNEKDSLERTYLNDLLNGYYREFSKAGAITKELYYNMGEVVTAEEKNEVIQISEKKDFHSSGKVKTIGKYKEDIPVGIHKEFDEEGNLVVAKLYSEKGWVKGKGIVDEYGRKQKQWTYFYKTGEVRSKGNYINNRKVGTWNYLFTDGKLEQEGEYVKGKPEGKWYWYYSDGKLAREEGYLSGKEEGESVEYDEAGEIVTKGGYFDGIKEGIWFYKVGDHIEKGMYKEGQLDGVWKHYYTNDKQRFTGKYILGSADGKHKYFYDNGNLKREEFYINGSREGIWRKFDKEGNVIIMVTYENNIEIKLDGMKVKYPVVGN